MSLTNRAFRNVWRKKNRTALVVIALGFTIATILSIYSGVIATNDNTQTMKENSIANTEELIAESNNNTKNLISEATLKTEELINETINSTQDLIDDTISNTQMMIDAIKQYMDDVENETELQLTKITITNGTMRTVNSISEEILINISGFTGIDQVIPIVTKSNGTGYTTFPGGGGMGDRQPGQGPGQGGIQRLRTNYTVYGIPLNDSLDEIYHLQPLTIINGTQLSENDNSSVLISIDMIDFFNAELNRNISIDGINFTVKGFYYSSTQNTTVYMNITDAQKLVGYNNSEINQIDVYAVNLSDIDNITSEIEYYYSDFSISSTRDFTGGSTEFIILQQERQIEKLETDRNNQIAELESSLNETITELNTTKIEQIDNFESDLNEQVQDFEEDLDMQIEQFDRDMVLLGTIGNIIIIISIITASLIIFFMMFYTVKERTREIGIFKALGFSGNNIMSQIIIEGMIIGFIGGILGIVISLFGGPFISEILLPNSEIFSTSAPDLILILLTIFTAAILGAVGTIYPAWNSSRRNPVDAIRQE